MSLAKLAVIAGRVLAVLCLYIGLALAARLLGVGTGSQSPLLLLGGATFSWLAVFTLGYLFAAVGIWIGLTWGYVIAIGTTFTEIVLVILGDPAVRLSNGDFLMALFVLVLAAGLFVVIEIRPLLTLHD
jgi:hypothetical protein